MELALKVSPLINILQGSSLTRMQMWFQCSWLMGSLLRAGYDPDRLWCHRGLPQAPSTGHFSGSHHTGEQVLPGQVHLGWEWSQIRRVNLIWWRREAQSVTKDLAGKQCGQRDLTSLCPMFSTPMSTHGHHLCTKAISSSQKCSEVALPSSKKHLSCVL